MAAKKTTKQPAKSKTAKSAGKTAAAKQTANRKEIGGIVCILLALFTVLTIFTKQAAVSGLYYRFICGLIGKAGIVILPIMLVMAGITLLFNRKRPVLWRVLCAFLTVLSAAALAHLFLAEKADLSWDAVPTLYRKGALGESGGFLGGLLAIALYKAFNFGAYIILIALIVFELMTALNFSLSSIFRAVKNRPRAEEEEDESYETPAEKVVNRMANKRIERAAAQKKKHISDYDLSVDEPPLPVAEKPKKKRTGPISPDEFVLAQAKKPVKIEKTAAELVQEEFDHVSAAAPEHTEQEKAPAQVLPPLKKETEEKVKPEEAKAEAEEIAQEIESNSEKPAQQYQFPPIDLLHENKSGAVDGTSEMRENTRRLSDTLKCFGIEPHIVNVTRGPTVTRYEIELDRGVKLSKITNLADDIALSLGATGVRISAIPDKISVVGIEVPNKLVSTVFAREVIDSLTFRQSKSRVSFAVGKDISGNCIVDDIAKLPHMLIAGTTGSGKSVCMNTLIISLLYKAKPSEVRMIMVDPKMVELGIYNGIPHLLIPVVTDPKKAAGALQWAVTEMMRRYRLMSEEGVRDLESYNKVITSDPDQKPLEQVVVVIDELADLMLVAAKEVEESICRIAQMGRASGIHLVIATQRPSADVITGLMKANIPSRIAFAVSSAMESRIILDTAGAEKLVGKGDMLFAPLGKGKPKRVQGCFITDEEIQDVVEYIKKQGNAEYSEDIIQQIEERAEKSGKGGSNASASGAAPAQSEDDGDELLPAAVEVILETGQASVSMLQRRLKLGYARAARIVDMMEERGIVGPFEGSKPRQLLITKEQWQAMQNGENPNPPVEEEIM
ncbi:MAG: DNA translocase FtsK [Clostridia bacterium]|nr:DNA translocase FtsK [Clostridia bacterium]